MSSILYKIAEENAFDLIDIRRLHGGDVNEIFHLKTNIGHRVVKLNNALKYPNMFKFEHKGLELLRMSNSFIVPKVFKSSTIGDTSYLMMEFIQSTDRKENFWEDFTFKLIKLHSCSRESFGLEFNNYIGNLNQINHSKKSSSEFYIESRLKPQFQLAIDHGFEFSNLDEFYNNISHEIPNEESALIHGDLWNGNYLVSDRGEAVLIDPAVAFASREMDLAMMKLFGGFADEVFEIYDENFPLIEGWKNRIEIWQLYYLLVHLNLFGKSYYPSIVRIMDRYI